MLLSYIGDAAKVVLAAAMIMVDSGGLMENYTVCIVRV